MRLPILAAIQNGVVLAIRIGRRHLPALATCAVLYAVVRIWAEMATGPLGRVPLIVLVIHGAATVAGFLILAVLVHREILVGPTPVQSLLSPPALGRMAGYFGDLLAVLGIILAPTLLVVFVSVEWSASAVDLSPRSPFTFALLLLPSLVGTRLWLKLPARAIDEPLTWRQAWALGQGNTLRLFVVTLVTRESLSWLQGLIVGAIAHASPLLARLLDGVFAVGLTVLGTAWVSVSYLYLTVAEDTVPAATAAQPET